MVAVNDNIFYQQIPTREVQSPGIYWSTRQFSGERKRRTSSEVSTVVGQNKRSNREIYKGAHSKAILGNPHEEWNRLGMPVCNEKKSQIILLHVL